MNESRAMNLIMDVDTGVDDAIALAMAVTSGEIRLLGVSTVAGNVSLEQATSNTLRVLDYLGAFDVPVFPGMSRPLVRDHFDAAHFHGVDGLGGAPVPGSNRQAESVTAPEFIVQSAREHRGDLTMVFVGPLTNLAVALALEPALPEMVSRTVIMGGAFDVPGNATRFAEFNIAVDPEAARIVAESGLDVTWVGLDVTHTTNLNRADWDFIDNDAGAPALLVRDVSRMSFQDKQHDTFHLHDPLAVGVALNDSIVQCQELPVFVDTSLRDTAGRTRMVVDSRAKAQRIATGVDSGAFRQQFGQLLGLSMVKEERSIGR
jgi:purine nucleosidase